MKLTSGKYRYATLLAICSIAFFSHLSALSPTIMEARNFISAREMLERGNWLIPTLNGQIRIRKPPLPTWLTAASIAMVDDPNNLAALRFPAAIIATIMIFFLYGLIKDIMDNTTVALYSAAILATSFMFIEESKTGAWDIYCNAFMLGGIWMLYRAFKANNLYYWLLSGVLMGCSFMSKGPVSFYAMLVPFLGAFFISRNKPSFKPVKGLLLCLIILVMISCAWPLYLYWKIPDIATQIVNEESSAWINRHNRPLWFYLHFPLFTGVWAIVVLYAFLSIRSLKATFGGQKIRLILFWFLITLVLLSVVPEKKERYFLPALPPLAILAGAFITHQLNLFKRKIAGKKEHVIIKVQATVMALAILAIPVVVWFYGSGEINFMTSVLLSLLAVCLLAILGRAIYKKRFQNVYPLTLLTILIFCLASWPFIQNMKQDNPAYQDLRAVRNIEEIRKRALYSTVNLNPIRLWEIGRKVNLLENKEAPKQDAVVITSSPLHGTSRSYTFHPNQDSEKEVLHFNVLE